MISLGSDSFNAKECHSIIVLVLIAPVKTYVELVRINVIVNRLIL